ncbi:hypothetical protein [Laribacter hongkongensis]|uniref:hypothetical protein n=1 Tax=Laribacter hongkongensis TaxID=168471 RepID=UPI001EFD53FC|nr:hypothetical protein [Laribacter hongkongensis]
MPQSDREASSCHKSRLSVFSILMIIIVLAYFFTLLVPSGQYDQVFNPNLQRQVPIAGTYHEIQSEPLTLRDIVLAPINGYYSDDHIVQAGDIVIFLLVVGGFIGVLNRTDSIRQGINQIAYSFGGKNVYIIPLLMGVTAVLSTLIGSAEELLPLYVIVIPIAISFGFDAIVGIAILMLGICAGYIGSVVNPFSVVFASSASGIKFTDGILFRVIVFFWHIHNLCNLYNQLCHKDKKQSDEIICF